METLTPYYYWFSFCLFSTRLFYKRDNHQFCHFTNFIILNITKASQQRERMALKHLTLQINSIKIIGYIFIIGFISEVFRFFESDRTNRLSIKVGFGGNPFELKPHLDGTSKMLISNTT